jgi:outer membrane protein assembly factor BamB
LVVDGLCIAQLGGRDNGALVAYELATGNEKWKWSGESPGYASPVLMTVGGTRLIVAETERRIVALSASDGKLAWETPFAPKGMGYNAATPIVDGETLIYTGSGRGVTAVKLEKGGDGFLAKELWNNQDKSVQFNTPVLKNGLLYGITQGNEIFCINAHNGQTAWSAPAGEATGGGTGGGRGRGGRGGFGSVVDAGSVLLALTPSSELLVFEPSDKSYTELARIKVADTPTHAHPVLSGNRVFIKDQDSVVLWTIPSSIQP